MTSSSSRPVTISVIVPTCHRNDLLARCLDVLAPGAQSLHAEKYEVIVTDDGSRSTAQAMVSELYPWASWVQGPRRGPAANRNNGARQARGEWLAFTDDDCLPSQEWLESFLAAIEPGVQVYDGKTTCLAPYKLPFETAPVNLTGGCLWSCNIMVLRQLFESMGGFDEMFPRAADEDTDLRERLKARRHQIGFAAGAVVDHPPRRNVWGKRTGLLWEAKVRLWYKHRLGCEPSTRRFLLFVLNVRARQLLRSRPSFDWVLAVLGLAIEIDLVTRSLGSWRRVHSGCPLFSTTPGLGPLDSEPSATTSPPNEARRNPA